MKTKTSRAFTLAMVVCVVLSGCGTQARRVDCDGKLEPINRPALKAVPSAPAPNSTRKDWLP